MTHRVHIAYYILWIAHPVLQLAIAAVMFRRKLHKAFPIFFAYIVAQIVSFAILFPAYERGSYAQFFYSYWILAAVSLALGFKVIHEVFLDVFRPYHTLKDLGSVLFKWAALVMLLVAGVVAAASPDSIQGPLVETVLTLQRCVRVIQCGLVVFLLVFARYLGVSRRQTSFGIGVGFGIFAFEELLAVALHASGHINPVALSLANMVAYNLSIMTWLGYTMSKSPAREAQSHLLMPQRWEQSLRDIQLPVAPDSLIPRFEGMVDRAFSRTPEPVPEDRVRHAVASRYESRSVSLARQVFSKT